MSTPELTARISDLIEETLLVDVPAPDADLIDAGLIDSLALISLITEIEREFGIRMPLDGFDVESFRSAEQIASYVATAQAG
jgi:D-alanine--poly(phosphoribitol) ligase subunit 2